MAKNTTYDIVNIKIPDPDIDINSKQEGEKKSNARVLSLKGTEGISQLYEFQLHISHTHEKNKFLDLSKLIGKEVKITINNHETGKVLRPINGFVKSAHIKQLKRGTEAYTESEYHIEIVPKLWFLTQTKDCRIFQDKTIEDILKKVLDEFDITHDKPELKDPVPCSPYKYCVQYQESHYNFLQRLMEQEGLYYYFEHSETETKLIIADHSNYKPIEVEGDTTIEWGEYASVKPSGKVESYKPMISQWDCNQKFSISKVARADFDYFQPPAPLLAGDLSYDQATRIADGVFDYPAKFEKKSTPEIAEKSKKILEEQLQTYKSFYRGVSNCIDLKPGYAFKLDKYPNKIHNQEYLITALHTIIVPQEIGQRNTLGRGHSGEGVEFRFLGIPINEPAGAGGGMSGAELGGKAGGAAGKHYAGPVGEKYGSEAGTAAGSAADDAAKDSPAGDVAGGATKKRQFRPQIMTPKPVIDGIQTAIVVGPPGEEVHTDKHGRVKVLFPWDREFHAPISQAGSSSADARPDNRSCWIRVAQSLAGPGWGEQFIPRVSQEVVVIFENGDPDRPLITGVVYNVQTGLPYSLPNEKFKSGFRSRSEKGDQSTYNEIFFDDKQGKELFSIQAQNDYKAHIKNNADVKIIGAKTESIDKTLTIDVKEKITLKVGDSTIEITPNDIKIKSKTTDVKGDSVVNVKGGKVNIN